MLWTSLTHKYSFDYHAGDIYWCTADIGWITGWHALPLGAGKVTEDKSRVAAFV